MSVPIVLFMAGLIVSLVAYVWGTLTSKLGKLEEKVSGLDIAKCRDCEPVTEEQVKEIIAAQFNEFRLELYRSGVLKAQTRKKTD